MDTTKTDIPAEALCTADLDFVLFCAASGYTSQMVRLAAVEKGAKWKEFAVDYGK